MCGGHGVYHLLEQLVAGMPGEQRSQSLPIARPDSSSAAMAQEVKLMYARGEIDAEVFHRMIGMAHSGQLDWGIVDGVQAGRRLVSQPAETLPQGSREPSPEFLERQRQLQEAHAETAQALQRLETELFRLHALAADAAAKAQLAEVDSEQGRAYLETEQGVLFRAMPLKERIASLRDSLQRIEMQLNELAERETQLRVLPAVAIARFGIEPKVGMAITVGVPLRVDTRAVDPLPALLVPELSQPLGNFSDQLRVDGTVEG